MRSILNEKKLNNKKILLRLDLNVPLKNGEISDTTRIDKILPTLNFLIQSNLFFLSDYEWAKYLGGKNRYRGSGCFG